MRKRSSVICNLSENCRWVQGREEDKVNGLTRAGGKQCVSNAGRMPDRYAGGLMGWQEKPLVRCRGGYRKDIKPGGTAEV